MDSNLLAMADAIRREAQRTQIFIEIASFLEHVGSLEQATNERTRLLEEAKSRLSDIHKKIDEAEAKRATAQAHLDTAHASAEQTINKARSDAKAQVADANAQAVRVVAEANDQCAKMKAAAQADADRLVGEAKARETAAVAKVAEADARLAKIRTDTDTAGKELAAVNSKLEEARRAARKMFEG